MTIATLFEADVVVGAEPGKHGELLASQTRHPAPTDVGHADVV